MTHRARTILTLGLFLATVVATGVSAQEAPADTDNHSDENVVIHFRMGSIDGDTQTTKKSYTLVVASGSMGSSLLAGKRVPFPTNVDDPSDDKDNRTFVYQNIGFATNVKAWVLGGNKIKLVADIEDSRVSENADGGLPIVETRQVTINAILMDGVPLELTRAEGVTDQAGFVEVEARVVR